jgi:hypothetical protein
MTDAMDVDLPDGISYQSIDFAMKDDVSLAGLLCQVINNEDAFKTIKAMRMYDLRPLLASGELNEVKRKVRERISSSECIP